MADFIGRAVLCKSRLQLLNKYLPGCGDYIEIGTLFGGSAVLAGQIVQGNVYCIDPLTGYYQPGEPDPICGLVPSPRTVRENWKSAGLDSERLHLRLVKTPPLPGDIPDRFDVAYIDGDHSFFGCRADWVALRDRVDQYIFFDDIDKPPVRKVFDLARNSTGWKLADHNDVMGVVHCG